MTIAALILALIATTPTDVSDQSPSVNAARGEPVLLDFHAAWCGPCKAMRPRLEQLASAGYPIRSIDAEQEKELAARYNVISYPTFIIVDDSGKQLARTEGFQPAADLASLYREAQAKVRSRPRSKPLATPVSNRLDDAPRDEDGLEPAEPKTDAVVNPQPCETVVRIRVRLSGGSEGVGSGTVIYADARQAIILTCAHIFKDGDRPPPPPSRFKHPISVDLFDGQMGGPKRNQVHYLETVKGEAIDYDPTNDVGLIRIRPGRVLPATRVVPPHWSPRERMHMVTVGCSEGRDATAWDTVIVRAKAGLKNTGTGETFHMIECDHAPKQGRSGGGLYTDDYYLAGVCDFADPQHNRGLYAVPQSIYKLLDRNKLMALYDPSARDEPKRLLAGATQPKRSSPEGTYRGQSPSEGELTMPTPGMLGIKPPVLAASEESGQSVAKPWRAAATKVPSRRREPADEGQANEAVPAGLSRDGEVGELPAANEPVNAEDLPAPSLSGGNGKWKPVRRP